MERLSGDTARQANTGEVKDLRAEAMALKELVADLSLENRLLKKHDNDRARTLRKAGLSRQASPEAHQATWPEGKGMCLPSSFPVGLHARQTYLTVMKNHASTSVLYNADCPVCNFEIRHYVRYAGAKGLPIRFDDLNTDACALWGLDADTAARRLYVLHEGALTSGVPAFLVLWAQMPRYRWLAKLVGLPGIRQIAELGYDHVLAPAIYRWHLHRLRKRAARGQD